MLGVPEEGDSIGIRALAMVDNTQVEEGAPLLDIGVCKEATVQAYRAVVNNYSVAARDFVVKFGHILAGNPSIPAPVKLVFEEFRTRADNSGW